MIIPRVLTQYLILGVLLLVSLLSSFTLVHAASPIPGHVLQPMGDELNRTNRIPMTKPSGVHLTIPPVKDRIIQDVDCDSSPEQCILVRHLVLQGVVDRPEHKIFIKDIEAIVHLEHPRHFSLAGLQAIADKITNYYRGKDREGSQMMVARAFIPAQDVEDGIVTIQVIEGTLKVLEVEDNDLYSADLLGHPFKELVGQPITKHELETALLRVSDYPGVQTIGVLKPGREVGTSDLVLKVNHEDPYAFALRADNHGTDFTGEYRFYFDATAYNLTGGADTLSATVMHTVDPDQSIYGSILYQRLIRSSWSWVNNSYWGLSYQVNDYDVEGALDAAELEGTTQTGSLYWTKSLIRLRNFTFNTRLGMDIRRAQVDTNDQQFSRDKLTVFDLGLSAYHVDHYFKGVNQLEFHYRRGVANLFGSLDSNHDPDSGRFDGNGEPAGGNFDKFTLQYSRYQTLIPHFALLFRFDGQYSTDTLVSMEQMSLGGPNSVRAYPISEFLRDRGLFTSAELLMDAPGFYDAEAFDGRTWGDILQISLFLDYAKGWNENAIFNDDRVELSGYGLGLRFNLDPILARFTVSEKLSQLHPSDDDQPQFYFDVSYKF